MVCCKVRGAEVSWWETGACDQTSFDSGYTCTFLGHILPTFPIPYSPQLSYGIQSLALCLLFRKKTTLYQHPLVKNCIGMLLFVCYEALLCSICSSTQTFHLSCHQHLNPPHIRGCCLTQTGKGQPPRFPTPNPCFFNEACLNSIHKCIMTGCPHSCVLNAPHYCMDAQHRQTTISGYIQGYRGVAWKWDWQGYMHLLILSFSWQKRRHNSVIRSPLVRTTASVFRSWR